MHIGDQEFELVLVEDTYRLLVDLLELVGELAEEVLVLQELVLEDQVGQLLEANPALQLDLLALCILLLSRQLARRLHAAH